MAPEGMVHALEEIHRLLRPDGALIDIRPFAEPSTVQVIAGDRVLYAAPKREADSESVIDSDRAMEEVLDRGLFSIERAEDFEFLSYGSTAPELREFWDRYNDFDPTPKEPERIDYEDRMFGEAEQIRKESGEGAEIVIRERVRIARLKPVRRSE